MFIDTMSVVHYIYYCYYYFQARWLECYGVACRIHLTAYITRRIAMHTKFVARVFSPLISYVSATACRKCSCPSTAYTHISSTKYLWTRFAKIWHLEVYTLNCRRICFFDIWGIHDRHFPENINCYLILVHVETV